MSFLNSLFLYALPAIALPVIVHLLARRRKKVIAWGAMQFLAQANPRARRSWRLKDLLLLLLRVFVLACFIIALARPLVPASWLGGHDIQDLILILDSSLSTQWDYGQETVRDRQMKLIEETLDDYAPTDFVRCLLAAERPQWLTTYPLKADAVAREALRKQLAARPPGLGSADLLASVEEALAADPAHPNAARHVIVITDGQAQGWLLEHSGRWAAVKQKLQESPDGSIFRTLRVSESAAESVDNLAVTHLSPNREVVALGEAVEVTATVQNFGKSASASTILTWRLSGNESLGVATVSELAPGASTTVKLEHPPEALGSIEISASIESGDGLGADNGASTRVEVAAGIPILVVDQSEASRYLQAALGPFGQENNSVFRGKQVTSRELAEEKLSDYQAIILTDVSELQDASVEELHAFVKRGGGLWLAPAAETAPDLFNERFMKAAAPLAPARLVMMSGDAAQTTQYETVSPPTQLHPATDLLADTERLDLDDIRIYRSYRFQTPLPDDLSVLLRGGGGHPLVIEKNLGKGRIITQALPLDRQWSNLPSMQVYVAMIYEWLWYITEASQPRLNLSAGEIYEVMLSERPLIDEATLASPNDELRSLTIETTADGDRRIRVDDTQVPGEYRMILANEGKSLSERTFRVARDRGESDLTRLDEAMLEKLRGQSGVLMDAEKPQMRPEVNSLARRQEPMWFWLLLSVIAFLVGESALAYSIAKSRTLTKPGASLSKAR